MVVSGIQSLHLPLERSSTCLPAARRLALSAFLVAASVWAGWLFNVTLLKSGFPA